MLIHNPTNFGDYRNCGSGDMFSMVEEQNFTCFHLNPSLLISLNQIVCYVRTYEISQLKEPWQ